MYIKDILNHLCSSELYDGKLKFNIFCVQWYSGNLLFILLTRLYFAAAFFLFSFCLSIPEILKAIPFSATKPYLDWAK